MRRSYRPLSIVLLVSAVLVLPPAARAQFRYGDNGAAGYGYAKTQAVASGPPSQANFNYSPSIGGYGPYAYQTPLNGFLTGAADVMNASGQYEIQHQQANLGRENVKSAHIDNRRKMFDELRYEKENTPTVWQVQAEQRYEQLQQARHSPEDTDVWSGTVLNVLLGDVRQIQSATGLRGALVPLDPDTVKHLNVGTGTTTGSSTMLNNGGKLKWPAELDDPRFDEYRKQIETLFAQATQEAAGPDGLTGRTTRALSAELGKLHDAIDGAVNDMTPTDNIKAMNYADQVTKAARLLKDPNVAKQLNGDWAPRGETVADLIENMNRNGQKFGPAGPADKPYYSSFYLSMLQYDLSLAQMVRRYGGSPGARQ